jgi:His-Xaa-Ser system protein HxsD
MAMAMSLTVTFSAQVYSVETIKKAAYRLSDLMSVDIRPSGDEIVCVVHFPSLQSEEDCQRGAAALRNEVLDQDLRSVVAKETEAVRNAVLAYAFSKTGLQGGD